MKWAHVAVRSGGVPLQRLRGRNDASLDSSDYGLGFLYSRYFGWWFSGPLVDEGQGDIGCASCNTN